MGVFKKNLGMMSRFDGPQGQEDMPYLLTPGPVTTSRAVKQAMLADMSPDDLEYGRLLSATRQRLLSVLGAAEAYEAVLLAGGDEAVRLNCVAHFCPAQSGKTLIFSNGPAGRQAAYFMERLGRPFIWFDKDEQKPLEVQELADKLAHDPTISHVWLVHGELSSGMVNPLAELAAVVQAQGRAVVIDACATVGALPLDFKQFGPVVVIGVGHFCLGSVPDLGFIIAPAKALQESRQLGRAGSGYQFDLNALWQAQSGVVTEGWLPSLPAQALLALAQALEDYGRQGSVAIHGARLQGLKHILVQGMRALGFMSFLDPETNHPALACFLSPADPAFAFTDFALGLRREGFVIAPGLLRGRPSFRMAVAGALDERTITRAIHAIAKIVKEQQLDELGPAPKIFEV